MASPSLFSARRFESVYFKAILGSYGPFLCVSARAKGKQDSYISLSIGEALPRVNSEGRGTYL